MRPEFLGRLRTWMRAVGAGDKLISLSPPNSSSCKRWATMRTIRSFRISRGGSFLKSCRHNLHKAGSLKLGREARRCLIEESGIVPPLEDQQQDRKSVV